MPLGVAMSEAEIVKLYSEDILELASNIPLLGTLDDPKLSTKLRSPLCGSEVTVDMRIEDGRISEFAQTVRACALGQASASIFARQAIGRRKTDIAKLLAEMTAFLKENGAPPSPPFEAYEKLIAARNYSNRHKSILLVIEATLQSFETNDEMMS